MNCVLLELDIEIVIRNFIVTLCFFPFLKTMFFCFCFFGVFFYQGFLSRTLTTHRTAGEGRGPSLFHSTTSTRSRTFRHLFATLHVRWLSHIFNCTACIYQTATRWDLPLYWITIWLFHDVMLISVCVFDVLILVFVTAIWERKPVDLNSHWLSPLYYKRTD